MRLVVGHQQPDAGEGQEEAEQKECVVPLLEQPPSEEADDEDLQVRQEGPV